MKKRIGSVLLALALCLSLLPATALAEDEGDTESSATTPSAEMPAYSGGSGTETDPWLISSVTDLQLLANTINDGKAAGFDADAAASGKGVAGNYYGYYFKQTANLDLSGIDNWDPIGYSGSGLYFAGNYDGDGHTISGAKSTGKVDKLDQTDKDSYGCATAGIFGWVAFGSVKNLTVKDAFFQATGVNNFGYAGGIAAVTYECTLENCFVYTSSITSQRGPNNSNFAGGITGIALESSFEKCASVGNTIYHGSYGGGFIGSLDGGNSNFTNCFAAKCTVTGYSDTGSILTESGGFLGASQDGYAILKNCFVYDCTAQAAKDSKAHDISGVFTGNTTEYDGVKAEEKCYYYEVNGLEAKTDNVTAETAEEFANGTVADLLGDAFIQGKDGYPIIRVPVTGVTLDKETMSLTAGSTGTLTATITPENATNKNLTWTSDNEAVVAVSDGVVSAVAAGTANITVTTADGGKTATCVVTVTRRSSSSSRPSYPITTPDKTENGSVTVTPTSAKRGSVVTITVTPDVGYVLDELKVTDKDGKELSLTKKSDTEYTFVMPAGKVEITPSFVKQAEEPSRVFVDVKTGDYFYDAVLWAVEKGITNGTSAETFSPEDPCTRAQIVTFLWRAAGSPVVNYAMDLSDVAGDAYYAEAVRWALSEGVTTGTSADQFSPDATCTREQAVTFLYRAAGSPAVSGESAFEDVGADAYYARAVAWAAQNGVTNGISQALFGTGSDCTRAQIVTFLYRAQQGK